MRYFLAALTLAAAGVGFVYLNPPAESNPPAQQTSHRPLFQWEKLDDPSIVSKSGSRSHGESSPGDAHAESILDTFVREHGHFDVSPSQSLVVTEPRTNASSNKIVEDIVSEDIFSSPFSSFEPELDDLALANPEPSTTKNTSESSRTRTPGASVSTATIVRSEKATSGSEVEIAPVGTKETTTSKSPTQAVTKKVAAPSEWKVVGKSTQGQPMHSRRFGSEGPRTLIVAGLDGEDRIAVRWIDMLSDELAKRPDLAQSCEVLILRAGNPDGLVKKVSENSRGVLINRNFPSRRYRPLSDMSAGAGPATEAETRVLLDSLYSFHPRRVVHLTATTAPSSVYYNRAAREIAAELQRAYSVTAQPIDIEQFPGSLEDFSDGTLEAGVLSLRLNAGNDWQQIWSKHLPVLLTAATGRVVGKPDSKQEPIDELARAKPDATRSPIPVSNTEPPRNKPRRGYEELPPPPK